MAIIAIASSPRAVAHEVVDGPAVMRKVRDDIAWVEKLNSFHMMARIEEKRTAEGIENDLRKLKQQFPDLEQFDPLKFTELLPEISVRLELDFDARRLRHCWLSRDALSRELSRDLRMWDGQRAVYHDQNFPMKRDRVLFRSNFAIASDGYWGWFSYLNQQPLVCWWNDNRDQREQLRLAFGEASDFVVVDREIYHGVDCHVLLDARHGYRDRFYVGVQDGRCYGLKKGVASFANVPNFSATHQRLIEDGLGRSLGENPSDDAWRAVYQDLETLSAARRAELAKRYYSAITKEVTPVWEIWYSDFRDLGEGRFLPFRETFLFHEADKADKKIFVSNQRTVFVRKVTLNQPLDDSLFEEAIADGAEIVDETTKTK